MLSFSELIIDPSDLGIDPTPTGAKRWLRSTIDQMAQLFDRSTFRAALLPQDIPVADAIVGRRWAPRNCLASNLQLRMELGSRLIDLLFEMQTEMPHRRFFLVTLVSDRWLSFDRYTEIWLGGMKGAARQVMRLGRWDGWFGAVEVQTLDETITYFGRILLPHIHVIAWSDDPDFDPEVAEANMSDSGRLESRVSAKTVDVRVDPSTSVCNLAAYIMKAPCVAKRRVPSLKSASGFSFGDSRLPPVSAVRQLEVLSGVEFDEILLSGGNGSQLRAELINMMQRRLPERTLQAVDAERSRHFWARARQRTRLVNYEPVIVDRSLAQLPSNPPISLACERRPLMYWVESWLLITKFSTESWMARRIAKMIFDQAAKRDGLGREPTNDRFRHEG